MGKFKVGDRVIKGQQADKSTAHRLKDGEVYEVVKTHYPMPRTVMLKPSSKSDILNSCFFYDHELELYKLATRYNHNKFNKMLEDL